MRLLTACGSSQVFFVAASFAACGCLHHSPNAAAKLAATIEWMNSY